VKLLNQRNAPLAQENREHIEEGGLQNCRINPMYEGMRMV